MQLKQYLSPQDIATWHDLVDPANNITVVGHSGPDGDAIGSILTMTRYLRSLGKQATPITPNAFPDFLRWLPGIEQVITYSAQPERVGQLVNDSDLIICLDFSSHNRLDELEKPLMEARKPLIVIDHHLAPQLRADLLISDPSASATCEIVFSILHQIAPQSLEDRQMAGCIYCGLMTDTGAFAYNSNRPELYHIVALLIAAGIDKDKIYRNVYYNYSESRLRLLGHILSDKMIYLPREHAAVFTLTTREMKQYNFMRGDAEGIVNFPLQIKGTRLSISLREDTDKPIVRVSLRSVDNFPCNKMAEEFFNGGGHLNAAGGQLPKPIDQALQTTLRAIKAYSNLLI